MKLFQISYPKWVIEINIQGDYMSDKMSTKTFAEKWGCTQVQVSEWCRNGLIKGAEQDHKGTPWRIPIDSKPPESYMKRKGLK